MKHTRSLSVAFALLAVGCPRAPTTATPDAAAPGSRADAVTDAPEADAGDPAAPSTRLTTFGSEAALRSWWAARNRPRPAPSRGASGANTPFGGLAAPAAPAAPMAQGLGGGGAGEGTVGMGSLGTMGHGSGSGTGSGYGSGAGGPSRARARYAIANNGTPPPGGPGGRVGGGADESITNNQVEGVDEGDIVKMHRDHLVILRRGRLFSVRLGDDALTPVSMVDAYGRGRTPGGWYDEMLVDGDTVVVIGYSSAAQASEVGLFDIDADGRLRWRDTMFVRSSDYYSARNYASRLVNHHLVMYMPVPLRVGDNERFSLPAVRQRPDAEWQDVLPYARLYRPVQELGYSPVIHTVLSCDLANRGFNCQAIGVVGPNSRNFYVSGEAVYLWVNASYSRFGWRRPQPGNPPPPPSVVYRFPLDCGSVGAVRARGAPLDQFSFDERAGTLRVFVRGEGGGDAMWGSEITQGDVGFLRVPTSQFDASVPTMTRAAYRGLPRVEGGGYSMQNRFVGDHLLYGSGQGWAGRTGNAPASPVTVYDVGRDVVTRLDIPHTVERVEPLGRDALVVGNERGGLTFTSVALDATPTLAGRHTVPGASQGETRSHGFFFRPTGDRAGMLGLPVTSGDDGGGWSQLRNVSSSVLFLGVDNLRFRPAGSLRSGTGTAVNDRCVASCADWYGNARPIFLGDRVFALLGYELVEGTVSAGRIRERRRTDVLRTLIGNNGDHRTSAFDHIPD